MFVYVIVVFSTVVITSALLLLIFRRIKLLNYRTVLAIALSSVLSALIFPELFNMVSGSRPGAADIPVLLFIMVTTAVMYIILALILGMIISFVVPEGVFKAQAVTGKSEKVREPQMKEAVMSETDSDPDSGENYLANIFNSRIVDNSSENANNGDNRPEEENYLEKSVDSVENIDKMGLETESIPEEVGLKAAENLSINDCVDEAFRLKELGDLEGAILYYMYALDRKPGKDLVFWIVLDICVLYKSLGQADFAHEMLSGYVATYSDVMDSSVMEEIERNLEYIQD